MMNKDDLMFEVVMGMAGALFLFIVFVKPIIDGIYQ
jgi:hypothetical protein